MRIAAIADRKTAAGFMLAGIKDAFAAENAFDAEKLLKKVLNTPDIAVLFITSDLAEHIRGQITSRRLRGMLYPVIVEIPPVSGEMKEDSMREIVKRAVGINMEK